MAGPAGTADIPSNESLIAMVQVIALISTIAFYLSGSTQCLKIHHQKSAKNVNFLPYMMTCMNCFLWLVYGTLKKDRLLYTVNSVGCIMQIVYIFVFIQNCDTKQYYLKRILAMVSFDLFILSFAYLADEEYDVLKILGYVAVTVTVIMFGSPLSTVREVIRTQSSETISVPLVLSTILVSAMWSYYGHLIRDPFVKAPNGIGLFLGLVQLFLVFAYRPVKRSSTLLV